ncbi:MAG: flippase-like domain-containing protein [Clostridiales bacterium]|nr:flippase-like domain-containing protein [Clostridiales bacterium]
MEERIPPESGEDGKTSYAPNAETETEVYARPIAQKKPSRLKYWLKTVFMLALIGFSVAIMFSVGDYISDGKQLSFSELVQTIDYPMLALFLGVIVAYLLVESTKYAYLLKVFTGKFHVKTALKTTIVGKYYDGVTPFSSGGQPFQVIYLHKKDIPKGAATAVPLAKFIVSTTTWCIFCLVLICCGPSYLSASANVTVTTTILIIACVSIGVNVAIPIGIMIFSFFPGMGRKLMAKLTYVLKKLHLVKKRYATTKKYVTEVNEYCKSIRQVFTKWKLLLPLVLICLCECVLNISIPFFAVISIANIPPTVELYFQIICLNAIAQFAAYMMPTPGSTGAMETTASLTFMTITGIDPVVGWIVLVWRFFTFYIYILSGMGMSIFEVIRDTYRQRKSKKRTNIE